MKRVAIKEESLQNLANLVRAKTGSTDTYDIDEAITAIEGIGLPEQEQLTVTENGYYVPTTYGFSDVTVNVFPKTEELTVTENGEYIPGCYGFSKVIVDCPPAPTAEELVITGNCQYKFNSNCWNWVINKYGDKITTKDITNANNMFAYSDLLTDIPFEFNFKQGESVDLAHMFYFCESLEHIPDFTVSPTTYKPYTYLFHSCNALKTVPRIYNGYPENMSCLFYACHNLRTIPDDYFDTWNNSRVTTYAYAQANSVFGFCYSLRKLPASFFTFMNDCPSPYYYHLYYSLAQRCYALDEITNLPVVTGTLTSNSFSNIVEYCNRLKNFTFATNEDGTPKTANWKSQTIDLSGQIGYVFSQHLLTTESGRQQFFERSEIGQYNSGITIDKLVYDDESYQRLKNDPDWFGACGSKQEGNYSRYNHDSALATIKSLPDTSAYGTNTIKFRGNNGNLTDGGAINTLTAEEIAIATAKGWTVTLS